MASNTQSVCSHCRIKPRSSERGIYPFCSERCKNADLGAWFREEYRIPVGTPDKDSEEADIQRLEDQEIDADVEQ